MRAPFILRFALAWAVLIGHYVAISVATIPGQAMSYRFDVHADTVKRWRARNDERRSLTPADAAARQRKNDMDGAFARGFLLAVAVVLLAIALYGLVKWVLRSVGVIW